MSEKLQIKGEAKDTSGNHIIASGREHQARSFTISSFSSRFSLYVLNDALDGGIVNPFHDLQDQHILFSIEQIMQTLFESQPHVLFLVAWCEDAVAGGGSAG